MTDFARGLSAGITTGASTAAPTPMGFRLQHCPLLGFEIHHSVCLAQDQPKFPSAFPAVKQAAFPHRHTKHSVVVVLTSEEGIPRLQRPIPSTDPTTTCRHREVHRASPNWGRERGPGGERCLPNPALCHAQSHRHARSRHRTAERRGDCHQPQDRAVLYALYCAISPHTGIRCRATIKMRGQRQSR
jgi:hypothetical protein